MKEIDSKQESEISEKIFNLVKEWGCDIEIREGKILVKEIDGSLSFCPDHDIEIETDEKLKEMIEKRVQFMMQNFGFVYVYICKDNREVAIEWPDGIVTAEALEDWKDEMKMMDEVIKDLYYEGWD